MNAMSMYVCMYVCMWSYVSVCMHNARMYFHVCAHIHAFTYVCMYVCK